MKENPLFRGPRILVFVTLSTLLLGFLDYITGYELGFFVFYFLPIAIAAWKVGPLSAYLISGLSSIVWCISDIYSYHPYTSVLFAFWNTIIQLLSFLVVAYSVSRIRFLFAKERQESQDRLSQVKTAGGLIPICASCKRIRDDKGDWQQVEEYVETHTSAQLTHGLCEECVDKLLTEAGIDHPPQLLADAAK